MPVPMQAFFVATIFVLLSVPVSLYEIAMHLENFNRPKLQTRIIRILFMVPIYALDRCAFILHFLLLAVLHVTARQIDIYLA
jgi:Organic solute transporter Ostalpha